MSAGLLRNRDVLGGALVCALGLSAIAMVRGNSIGTLERMGPGFFPTLIGVVMLLAGAALILGAVRAANQDNALSRPDLRAWTMVPLSLVAFIVVGEYGGLLPATFSVVFIAALADRDNSWRHAALLAAVMVAVCVIVFWWALQVQFPLLNFGLDQ